jgi:hypothetical protein
MAFSWHDPEQTEIGMFKIICSSCIIFNIFHKNILFMKCHQLTKIFILVILLSSCLYSLQVSAQQNTSSLYSQTSEMADAMIQYDADKASILRFYSTSSQGDFFQDNKDRVIIPLKEENACWN